MKKNRHLFIKVERGFFLPIQLENLGIDKRLLDSQIAMMRAD